MHIQLSDNINVLAIDKIPSFEDFCNLMKVSPNSFSAGLMWKIFRAIFVFSQNQKELYNDFYSIEYNSFQEYLWKTKSIKISNDMMSKNGLYIIESEFMLLDQSYDESYLIDILNILSEEG